MSKLSYASEKLGNALYSLVQARPIQDRLYHAFLSFHTLSSADFDVPEMRTRFDEIDRRLTAVKDGNPDDGHVLSTVKIMSDDDADEIAKMILDLYFSVNFAIEDARHR